MMTDRIILEHFINHHPTEAVRLLLQRKMEDITQFLNSLTVEMRLKLLTYLDRQTAIKYLKTLNARAAAEFIEKLPRNLILGFVRQLSEGMQEAILNSLGEEISIPLRRTLHYPENSAGALADPFILVLPKDLSTKEALNLTKKYPDNVINYLYIVNHNQMLVGVINFRELLSAGMNRRLSAVMHSNVAFLAAALNFSEILDHPAWQEYHALPVVDETGVLLGAIRYKTLKRIERESKKSILPAHAISAINALGELYHIGLTGLIRGATTPLKADVTEHIK